MLWASQTHGSHNQHAGASASGPPSPSSPRTKPGALRLIGFSEPHSFQCHNCLLHPIPFSHTSLSAPQHTTHSNCNSEKYCAIPFFGWPLLYSPSQGFCNAKHKGLPTKSQGTQSGKQDGNTHPKPGTESINWPYVKTHQSQE